MNNQVFFSNNSFCHNPRGRNLNHMYIKKGNLKFPLHSSDVEYHRHI